MTGTASGHEEAAVPIIPHPTSTQTADSPISSARYTRDNLPLSINGLHITK